MHTPHEPAKAFFETIGAPHKRFITLERLAHVPMPEEPGLFLLTLIQEALPLTEGRAAFAPMRSMFIRSRKAEAYYVISIVLMT